MKTYLVNGFLDSGKTTFIKDLLHQDYFATGEPTLLLLCEEGEIEYDADDLKANRIYGDPRKTCHDLLRRGSDAVRIYLRL